MKKLVIDPAAVVYELRFAADVFASLATLRDAGYRFSLSSDDAFVHATLASQRIVIEPRQDGSTVVRSGDDWTEVVTRLTGGHRTAHVERRTKETAITVDVDLDREGPIEVSTGIGFFDHMIEQVAKHGGFSLRLACLGDLQIDEHHTVEDCALALGQGLREALGEKLGIARFGFLLPMDEAQAQVAIDLAGRPFAVFEGTFGREQVGGLPTELVPHFFRSLGEALGAAIHLSVRGDNTHHMVEACFKATGRALRQAFRIEGRELPSSKGVL